jgi:hypothetical protein
MAWDIHQRLAFEERAGILQFDGGLPRAEAERRARRIIDGVDEVPEQQVLTDDAGMQFFSDIQRMFR